MYNNALARLEFEYPTDFDAFLAKPCGFPLLSRQAPIHFKLLGLVKELHLRAFMPYLQYQIICTYNFEKIFHGVTVMSEVVRLPSQLQQACIIGYSRLLQLMPPVTFAWLFDDPIQPECQDTDSCFETFRYMRQNVWKTLQGPHFALADWDTTTHTLNDEEMDLCEDCEDAAKASHEKGRQQIFSSLPWGYTVDGREFFAIAQANDERTLDYIGRLPTDSIDSIWPEIRDNKGCYTIIGSKPVGHVTQIFDVCKLLELRPSGWNCRSTSTKVFNMKIYSYHFELSDVPVGRFHNVVSASNHIVTVGVQPQPRDDTCKSYFSGFTTFTLGDIIMGWSLRRPRGRPQVCT
ncbi:hypothetical protein CVT24_006379 [Panaeolus cyanescens]|uniref:Uncharacterized protein n=1 Tax=Panaeolus cyanescens TaxID=181874 RepID=A0A409WHH9_9AGAR|nr:hypothetical protein CVT24_006379 [Panaeolus cyanescens]